MEKRIQCWVGVRKEKRGTNKSYISWVFAGWYKKPNLDNVVVKKRGNYAYIEYGKTMERYVIDELYN
jgi:hypothetical protein